LNGKLGWKRNGVGKEFEFEGKMELKRQLGWQGSQGRMRYRKAGMGIGGVIGKGSFAGYRTSPPKKNSRLREGNWQNEVWLHWVVMKYGRLMMCYGSLGFA